MNLEIFYKNNINSDKFDRNSFVGKIIFDMSWSDSDYWELDNVLIQILNKYQNKKLPKEIFSGIISIFIEIIGIKNKTEIYITNEEYEKNSDNIIPDIYARFERLNILCKDIIFKQEFNNEIFWYKAKEKL